MAGWGDMQWGGDPWGSVGPGGDEENPPATPGKAPWPSGGLVRANNPVPPKPHRPA